MDDFAGINRRAEERKAEKWRQVELEKQTNGGRHWWESPAIWVIGSMSVSHVLEHAVLSQIKNEVYRGCKSKSKPVVEIANPTLHFESNNHIITLREIHERQGVEIVTIDQVNGRGEPVRFVAAVGG